MRVSFYDIMKHHNTCVFVCPKVTFYALCYLHLPDQKVIEKMAERAVAKVMTKSSNSNIPNISVSNI